MKQSLENTKIAFMGTPDISAVVLEKLIDHKANIAGVFCGPDKISGRGRVLSISPVKKVALKFKLPLFQPKTKVELLSQIKKLNPDLSVVFAHGMILPKEAVEFPKYKTLNIHPSLLPKYRGPSPIATAILKGEKETGVSIIKMIGRVDAGPILNQKKIKVEEKDTTEILGLKIAKISAEILINLIPKWADGEIKETPQEEKRATFTKIFKKEDGHIDWSKSAEEISNQVRAFTPWPGSFAFWKKNEKKILLNIKETEPIETPGRKHKVGEVFIEPVYQINIQTKKGALKIKRLQLEGKKELRSKEFLIGHPQIVGVVLE